jgi:predicted nucleotidyltransferase component of viral defense system
MARELKNVGTSVRARLLERARTDGTDFQNLLTRYALERLLYRLSLSSEREAFVLKGAMLFTAWLSDPFRPTQDLDLLGSGDQDASAMASRFRQILSTKVPDDGVIFDIVDLRAAPIREEARYGGVRLKTVATIAGAKVPIQIDVGFGDVVTPAPIELEYPTLLDAPPPKLKAYPMETVVAEKFEAIVTLGVSNSRMKDFYDLWMIASTFAFDSATLTTAIRRTFERRGTPWPAEPPYGLTEGFAVDKAALWRAFMTRERLGAAPLAFDEVVAGIGRFLLPILQEPPPAHWDPGGPWTPAAT